MSVRSCLSVALALLLALSSGCGSPTDERGEAVVAQDPVPAGGSVERDGSDGSTGSKEALRVSGPYVHDNLVLYLLHGPDSFDTSEVLTLEEAMAQQRVVVHETGNVNELAIEVVGDQRVFVQAGDVVKGGKQDRVLGVDILIAKADGRVPIGSYCVEQGRWQQRGNEALAKFSGSFEAVAGNQLKSAIREQPFQAEQRSVAAAQVRVATGNDRIEVQEQTVEPGGTGAQLLVQEEARGTRQVQAQGMQVEQLQRLQSGSLVLGAAPAEGGAARPAGQQAVWSEVSKHQRQLMSNAGLRPDQLASASSYQLSVENKQVAKSLEAYQDSFKQLLDEHEDAIGFAYAINGEINAAEVYPSHDLLRRLWPKMLKATAVEALGLKQAERTEPYASPENQAVSKWLQSLDQQETEQQRETHKATKMNYRTKGTERLYETVDESQDGAILHKTYLK